MQFNSRTVAISTHRRIELDDSHVDRLDLRPTLKEPLTDHSGQMLHKIYRFGHRLGHQLIHFATWSLSTARLTSAFSLRLTS